jgi:tetratricopeptide (TPR) repeat protein
VIRSFAIGQNRAQDIAGMPIPLFLNAVLTLFLWLPPGQRQESSIQGSINFEEGSANAPILVFLEAVSWRPVEQTYTDVSGNFTFRDVAPGSYYVRVKLEGFEEYAQRLEVPAYNRELTIFLRRASRVPPKSNDIPLGTKFRVDVRQLSIPEKAVRQYQKALDEDKKGKTSSAVRLLRDALVRAPNFLEAAFQLAATLYKTGSFQDAEKTLMQGLAIDPKNDQFRLMLVNVLIKEKKYEQALAEIDSYMEENPLGLDKSVAATIRSQLIHDLRK